MSFVQCHETLVSPGQNMTLRSDRPQGDQRGAVDCDGTPHPARETTLSSLIVAVAGSIERADGDEGGADA